MLVYILNKEELTSFTLPSIISGSYWIKDSNEKNLINISEENGKWKAYSNKNVRILANKEALREVVLNEYQFLILQIKDEAGYYILYTSPVNDLSYKYLEMERDCNFTIGSSNDNAFSCNNQLISPKQVEITYQNRTWLIKDLNSEYKTFINNKALNGMIRLNHGDVIFIMGVKIIVLGNMLIYNNPLESVNYNNNLPAHFIEREENKEVITTDEEREIELYNENDYFIRSPRFVEIVESEEFKIDGPPNYNTQEDQPFILTIGPMITMASTSFVMLLVAFMSMQNGQRDMMSVLPTIAISISMMAGTLLWPVINRKYTKKQQEKKKLKAEKKYNEYLTKKEVELQNISTKQKQILLSNNISPIECYQMIINKSRTLWGRELHQKDFLSIRLGIGRTNLAIKLNYPTEHFTIDDNNLEDKMRIIVNKYKYIEGVPIVENLIEKNIIAITGKYEYIKPYTDLLLLQMVALHSYYDLKIVILTNEANKDYWSNIKLMPHIFNDDKTIRFFATNSDEIKELSLYLQRIITAREKQVEKIKDSRESLYKNFSTYYMIITDDYKLAKSYPLIDEILEMDGNLGFSLLMLHPSLANLPTATKAFIGINDMQSGGIFENELVEETQKQFTIEPVDKLDLAYCSVRLLNIPIENKENDFVLPKSIGFLEMYDVSRIEQLNPIERWKVNNPINSLAVPIGISTDGKKFKLDLHEKEEGPHGLIAGMTGSGKSEFIITYILSMAINFHPDEVQFVLIDYKGGGLVGAFENQEQEIVLPHLAGTITNLETADINRALASIESELKRRQKLFNEAREELGEGTIDIYKYQKYYREGLLKTAVSHLFIISDEFAELKSQQPEFMDQLISTARIGRSLGVHLILATQKPSGVVNDQIWSNSRFRVCLKVQEASDSNEVIKRPDAAAIKETGRFYLQVGYDELFALGQAAWAGAPYIPEDKVYHQKDDSIVFINDVGESIKTINSPKKNIQVMGEQLPNIVKYLSLLAKKNSISVKQLWLPKIPAIIYVDDLKKKYNFKRKPFNIQIILGEYDNPASQSQGLLTIDLANKGNTVIYSMNEKNTITNTILYSLITNYTTDEVNIYALDFDNETLKIYEDAPQVGDVIFASEEEKVDKLLKLLTNEIERRKKLLQEYNGSYEFYCTHSGTTMPAIVFLLSGYENFKEAYEDYDGIVNKISRDGSKYGIYTIITAISDRALRLNMRANFPVIIPLKLSAQIDYNMLLGKKTPMLADINNRGVALIKEEPYEFQTASICPKEQLSEYIKKVVISLNEQIISKAKRVPVLPDIVTIKDVVSKLNSIANVPVGIVEETLDIATYNFKKNLIHLINSEDMNMLAKFTRIIVNEISSLDNIEVVVIDLKDFYNLNTFTNCIYHNETNDSFKFMSDKVFESNRTKELVVFVIGIEKMINTLDITTKNSLLQIFSKMSELKNVSIVLVGRVIDIKTYAYENWFRQFTVLDGGIYIGRGLNNSTIHSISTPLRILSSQIPANFGYVIDNGSATRIKVLEGDE